MTSYEYRHTVGFEDTNLIGNVYYVNHLRWQGRVREMFLHEHAPDVLNELKDGLALVTVRCSCDYIGELRVFDEVCIRMRIHTMTQSRVTMHFEYWKIGSGMEELVARGEQQIACMRRDGSGLTPTALPASLRSALQFYAGEMEDLMASAVSARIGRDE